MARVLSIHRATVPASERVRYFERLRERASHYHGSGCRFWVFEEAALAGAFLEYVEADDFATLASAIESAPGIGLSPIRIYQQVEID